MESEFPVLPVLRDQLSERCHTLQCALRSHSYIAPPAVSISRELSKPITFPDGRLPAGLCILFSKQFLKIIEFWGPW